MLPFGTPIIRKISKKAPYKLDYQEASCLKNWKKGREDGEESKERGYWIKRPTDSEFFYKNYISLRSKVPVQRYQAVMNLLSFRKRLSPTLNRFLKFIAQALRDSSDTPPYVGSQDQVQPSCWDVAVTASWGQGCPFSVSLKMPRDCGFVSSESYWNKTI